MSGHIIYIWDATNHGQPQSFDEAVTTFQKLIHFIEQESNNQNVEDVEQPDTDKADVKEFHVISVRKIQK